MKYTINRKYALKQYENLDLGVVEFEGTKEEALKQLAILDEICEEYKEKLNKCCLDFPSCSCSQPIKVGDTPAKKPRPF